MMTTVRATPKSDGHDGPMVSAVAAEPHGPRIRDLGPLVVRIDGSERSPGPRPAAALALLLINANRRVAADALREAMWGDATGDRVASSLETHMFRLRQVVDPARRPGEPPSVVPPEPGGYRLVVASHWCMNRGHDVGQAPVVLEIRADPLTPAGRTRQGGCSRPPGSTTPGPGCRGRAGTSRRPCWPRDRSARPDPVRGRLAGRPLTLADIVPITDDLGAVVR